MVSFADAECVSHGEESFVQTLNRAVGESLPVGNKPCHTLLIEQSSTNVNPGRCDEVVMTDSLDQVEQLSLGLAVNSVITVATANTNDSVSLTNPPPLDAIEVEETLSTELSNRSSFECKLPDCAAIVASVTCNLRASTAETESETESEKMITHVGGQFASDSVPTQEAFAEDERRLSDALSELSNDDDNLEVEML
jgi:hypothetical protein